MALLLGSGAARAEDETRKTSPSAADVCAQEKENRDRSRQGHLQKHPSVVLATARAQAACQPSPTGACALARADFAEAMSKFRHKHPKYLETQSAVTRLCPGQRHRNGAEGPADR